MSEDLPAYIRRGFESPPSPETKTFTEALATIGKRSPAETYANFSVSRYLPEVAYSFQLQVGASLKLKPICAPPPMKTFSNVDRRDRVISDLIPAVQLYSKRVSFIVVGPVA